MNTGFQQQRPWTWSAAVRSAPSPQHGAHLEIKGGATRASSKAAIPAEEKSFGPSAKR